MIRSIDESPVQVFAGVRWVGSMPAYNPGASGAYIKLYQGASAPDVATDPPIASVWLAAGESGSIPVGCYLAGCWVAAAQEPGPGATPPASPLLLTTSHAPPNVSAPVVIEPPPPPTGEIFALPAVAVYPQALSHFRRLAIGGEGSRMWFAFTYSATDYVVHYVHNGHGADPGLAGHTPIVVDLGASDNTAPQVFTATAAALAGAGIAGATNTGTDSEGRVLMRIPGSSDSVIPPEVDTVDTNLRGMFGMQRDDWGDGNAGAIILNEDGGTDGTATLHIPPLSTHAGIPAGRAARIHGAYICGSGGYRPRLAVGVGTDYSLTPGAITIVGQGIVPTALFGGAWGAAVFAEPVDIDTDDHLTLFYRGDTATSPGGPRYRVHESAVPPGNGDLVVGERLVWDTTTPYANTDAFGGTYTPVPATSFAIYAVGGLLIEVADAAGNYHARGPQAWAIGDQNNDPLHGTQFLATEAQIENETTHHRSRLPDRSPLPVTEIRRAVASIAVGNDSRAAFYGPWTDLAVPFSAGPSLIADLGLVGLHANPLDYTTLAVDVDLGDAAGGYVSLGWNYVTAGGGLLSDYQLPVYVDAAFSIFGGDNSYLDCWVDDRATWHDDIRGASELALPAETSEYRTAAASAMPHTSYAETWPATFTAHATDDTPPAIALDRYVIRRAQLALP